MKMIISLGLAALMITQPLSATVLLKAPDALETDYRAVLMAATDLQSPSEYLLGLRPARALRRQLLDLFTEAQQAFLSGSLEAAATRFEQLMELSTKDDWAESDREVLVAASLRLGQIHADDAAVDQWLARSLAFGDIKIDANLYPPPLLKRRDQLAVKLKRSPLPGRWFSEGWQVVLVNGRKCTVRACDPFVVDSGNLRLTFISDQWATQSVEVSREGAGVGADAALSHELESLRIPRQPWIQGSCGATRFHAGLDELATKKQPFWSLDCGAGTTTQLAVPSKNQGIRQIAVPPPATSPPLYKNKWFWAGVGLVTAAIVISAQKNSSEREPTTTYGY